MTPHPIILGVFITIAAVYSVIMLVMTIGIFRSRKNITPADLPATKVTVIIPARNEELNIFNTLQDLALQDYPSGLYEVILVDDGSTDGTQEIAERFRQGCPGFHLTILSTGKGNQGRTFKKEAIRMAILKAAGELILTTDADVRTGKSWISSVVATYERSRPKMILGPVAFHNEHNFFTRIQSLEFMALMTATAGLCRVGMPVMCNGANLAYEKKAFTESGGFDDNLGFPSGDDMFLMSKFRKRYGAGAVRFLWDEKSVVRTDAVPTFDGFWQQRVRWVSKNKGYRDFTILFVAIVTYLFNFILLAGLVAGIFSKAVLFLTIILFALKMVIEFPALWKMAGLPGKRKLLWLVPVVQLLNVIYVSVVGLVGNFLSYEWKGRKS